MLRLYTHARCLQHDPGPGHPESPARLRAVLAALDQDRFARLDRVEAPAATVDQLARVHERDYIERILAGEPAAGVRRLDEDTLMSPGSAAAALHAAGAVVAATDAVIAGQARAAFCAVRPPGHHAGADRAMGFCLFNNVAVGAAHALVAHGLQRVAIADFDVHHGNGTQDLFAAEPRVLFLSSHQAPLYPGTGAAAECGVGNVVNAPLPAGTGSADFRRHWAERLLPRLDAFRPELLLVSAGFDAHHADPMAGLELETDDYRWLTGRLLEVARTHADGRVVSTLEGGYDTAALARCVVAHVAALGG